MNVLVTGGAGYIGSHTCKALAQEGFLPIVYDNLSTGHEWAVKWGPLVRGDLSDAALLRTTILKYRIHSVIHFAALSYVGESMHSPRRYYRNNLVNTLMLLDAMIETGAEHIVFSSTCATYGLPRVDLLDESHPQSPVNPYGDTKLAIERAMMWYARAYPIRFIALRYFNAAGADPEAEIGELHDPETHLIPLVLESVTDPARPVSIFGHDYPTPDGTAIRDYIHVSDLANAHVRSLGYLMDGGDRTAFNLGTGTGHSVREIIGAVERVTRRPVRVIEGPRRPGDPHKLVANALLALSELGWRPIASDLDHIVRTAWCWHDKISRCTSQLATTALANV